MATLTLAHLSAAVRARAPSLPLSTDAEADAVADEWARAVAELRTLGEEAQSQLVTAAAGLDALDFDGAAAADSDVDERVWRAGDDAAQLLSELEAAARHFRDVAMCAAPVRQRLAQLEARAAYLRAALEVERLSVHVRELAGQATDAALDAFQELSAFVAALPHDYTHVREEAERRLAALTRELQAFALEKLQSALEAIAWPAELTTEELQHKLSQATGINATADIEKEKEEEEEEQGLWAVDALLDAVLVRFRYHFERPASATNRLAKPEWMLSHILAQVRAHAPFLAAVVSPALAEGGAAQQQQQPRSSAVLCSDAQVLLLQALVCAAQRKLRADLPRLVSSKALFCHTLDEVLLFERAVDAEVGYASWAHADRRRFPRCVDVFTAQPPVFIAWTSVDVAYAQYTLATAVFGDRARAWAAPAEAADGERGVPTGALHAAALLDFLCRRFVFMATDEHRFLYVTHVLYELLKDLRRECERQARAINVRGAGPHAAARAVAELCAVLNAVQYTVALLSAWEQSSLFIELTKKVVQSDTSRRQVLQMHLAYSQSVLASAAHAASSAVLAREEAVAVRHAIAGPGSLIGPTAAFSAAYSVGSKTVRSLLGRADAAAAGNEKPVVEAAVVATGGKRDASERQQQQEDEDEEELIFSRSIFERQIADFDTLRQRLLETVIDASVAKFHRDAKLYKQSVAFLDSVVAVVRELLSVENRASIARSVATALDDVFFNAVVNGPFHADAFSTQQQRTHALTTRAARQFALDVSVLSQVLERCAPKSSKHLRRAADVVSLTRLGAAQLREVRSALDASHGSAVAGMEQLTTMLEVCGVHTLTPTEVVAACGVLGAVPQRGLE
ncbi:hypothetical protein PybrP1_012266 [[Pythium] brassicae (nom. inval.)]|nr:hypothetical protein PybrP1_012266 [[Pythium] brassicae (nom. inval.)]